MVVVHFIRHAESTGNVNNHIVGGRSSHLPLTERGVEQAHLLGQRLKEDQIKFDKVYASDAVRAIETAQIALSYLNFPPKEINKHPQLAELSQGDWEGLVRDDVFTPEVTRTIEKEPLTFRAPNGESQEDIRLRMYDWLTQEVKSLNGQAKDSKIHIAAFSHGFAIRSLIGYITGADPYITRRITTYNTSISSFYLEEGVWFVERVNDHAHLRGTEFIGHY